MPPSPYHMETETEREGGIKGEWLWERVKEERELWISLTSRKAGANALQDLSGSAHDFLSMQCHLTNVFFKSFSYSINLFLQYLIMSFPKLGINPCVSQTLSYKDSVYFLPPEIVSVFHQFLYQLKNYWYKYIFNTHLYIRAFPYITRAINMAHLNFLSNVASKNYNLKWHFLVYVT